MKLRLLISFATLLHLACSTPTKQELQSADPPPEGPYLLILGVAQDAGYPHIGCQRSCCEPAWSNPSLKQKVVSIAIIDPGSKSYWILDASPDLPAQLRQVENRGLERVPNGIFLTHGHIGHYTGLMYLGREALGSQNIPVYAMHRMDTFLRNNGPWSQLVKLGNIQLIRIRADSTIQPSDNIRITAFRVPHRHEFTETVGFRIAGPNKVALYIPDIDKWERWDRSIVDEISRVDYAFVDGSFFRDGELNRRDMSQIPHPFIEESIVLFKDLPENELNKVHFIHFNHTNPVLDAQSEASGQVRDAGLNIAVEGEQFVL